MELKIGNTEDMISAAHSIRYAVFTEEQGIPSELDHDGKDESSYHVLIYEGDSAVATARLYTADGLHAVMARVAVRIESRHRGIAGKIVAAVIDHAKKHGLVSIEIHAHKHLRGFYERFGFEYVKEGEVVGGHPLIEMKRVIGNRSVPL